jgi:hypothetical protein
MSSAFSGYGIRDTSCGTVSELTLQRTATRDTSRGTVSELKVFVRASVCVVGLGERYTERERKRERKKVSRKRVCVCEKE